ncbi:Xanthine/uracil permease [Ceraceosorus guamensis]|uniref:Xanthine/uracil permease n=1 Tax=Ceraceosorus guamensis TaxID=1522189 RepID=A0A316W834_9BASI|nr:Xanthine/uracil permease [Ceraceosorus guamensis]PWN46039.1 Xanthine/uracil permease [Ceraceosorus guamensis]
MDTLDSKPDTEAAAPVREKNSDSLPSPSTSSPRRMNTTGLVGRAAKVVRTQMDWLSTREAWLGSYNYRRLFQPRWLPWARRYRRGAPPEHAGELPFYGLNDPLPIVLAAICGLQHCLAMLAGLITPPIIVASTFSLDASTSSYLISASLIASGLLSLLQMSAIPLSFIPLRFFKDKQIGTGIISVVGTSFNTLSAASSISTALYADGVCPTSPQGARLSCPQGYGYLLGTSALCALLQIGISFVPVKLIRRAFPPLITGPVVFLIGANLIGSSGFLDWAGGSGECSSRPASGQYSVCPQVGAPHALPWGSPEYLGLGFFSFMTIVFVELFGSPAMRSASIVIGLIIPTVTAGIGGGYTSRSSIDAAPAITFLWTETFPLRVYGPAVLPLLAVYLSMTAEATGDITAASEMSRLSVQGADFDRRIQGGILSDGLGGLLSALGTITPLSVFAQNTSTIGMTRVANRRAGYWCCGFLVLFGILGKIAGAILAIPAPILGGVTSFLFASVAVAGLSLIARVDMQSRRNRFVLASSLMMGCGNLLVKDWATYLLPSTANHALAGFFTSIKILIQTPFVIAAFTGFVANAILPYDGEDLAAEERAQKASQASALELEIAVSSAYHKGATTSSVVSAAGDEQDAEHEIGIRHKQQ